MEKFLQQKEVSQEEKEKLLNMAVQLEHTEDDIFIQENLPDFFNQIETVLGIKLTSNVNNLYKKMVEEDCLARIESVSKVIAALEEKENIHVGEGESHYANAVIPESEGIKLAFSEGQAQGPVRLIVGFGKTLIGFKTDHLEVKKIEFSSEDMRDIKRAYLCRHIDGELRKDDIKTVVMRIPKHYLDEGLLTKEEERKDPLFVFRGFTL